MAQFNCSANGKNPDKRQENGLYSAVLHNAAKKWRPEIKLHIFKIYKSRDVFGGKRQNWFETGRHVLTRKKE